MANRRRRVPTATPLNELLRMPSGQELRSAYGYVPRTQKERRATLKVPPLLRMPSGRELRSAYGLGTQTPSRSSTGRSAIPPPPPPPPAAGAAISPYPQPEVEYGGGPGGGQAINQYLARGSQFRGDMPAGAPAVETPYWQQMRDIAANRQGLSNELTQQGRVDDATAWERRIAQAGEGPTARLNTAGQVGGAMSERTVQGLLGQGMRDEAARSFAAQAEQSRIRHGTGGAAGTFGGARPRVEFNRDIMPALTAAGGPVPQPFQAYTEMKGRHLAGEEGARDPGAWRGSPGETSVGEGLRRLSSGAAVSSRDVPSPYQNMPQAMRQQMLSAKLGGYRMSRPQADIAASVEGRQGLTAGQHTAIGMGQMAQLGPEAGGQVLAQQTQSNTLERMQQQKIAAANTPEARAAADRQAYLANLAMTMDGLQDLGEITSGTAPGGVGGPATGGGATRPSRAGIFEGLPRSEIPQAKTLYDTDPDALANLLRRNISPTFTEEMANDILRDLSNDRTASIHAPRGEKLWWLKDPARQMGLYQKPAGWKRPTGIDRALGGAAFSPSLVPGFYGRE